MDADALHVVDDMMGGSVRLVTFRLTRDAVSWPTWADVHAATFDAVSFAAKLNSAVGAAMREAYGFK